MLIAQKLTFSKVFGELWHTNALLTHPPTAVLRYLVGWDNLKLMVHRGCFAFGFGGVVGALDGFWC